MLAGLELENFRIFKSLRIPLDSASVIFAGGNGQGKTSVLEAVYFLANLRSFRTLQLKDLKSIGTQSFRVAGSLEGASSWKIALSIETGIQRALKIDGAAVARASEFTGRINTVAFLPGDSEIICGPAQIRRRFFDMFLCMTDRSFMRILQQYNAALKSRNILLKNNGANREILFSYNAVLAEKGVEIVRMRKKFIPILSDFMRKILLAVRPELADFDINLIFQKESCDPEWFKNKLESSVDKDIRRGFTSFGPHLDDFDFISNLKSLKTYGSRGQLRIVSFALKLAQYETLKFLDSNRRSAVILLVDDVIGELDAKAKESFFSNIERGDQIMYTFTEIPPEMNVSHSRIFNVKDGVVNV